MGDDTAGRAVGARRFVAQSNVAIYARVWGPVKVEEDALDTNPSQAGPARTPRPFATWSAPMAGDPWIEGVALRYRAFYGRAPG